MRLSQKRVAKLWIAEGGDPHKADEWSAIVMGESGGDTKAHENNDPNSCCHGIAQLNVEVGNATMRCALNPVCATRKSIKLSGNGRDFSPWGAYTDGRYTAYLGKSGVGDGSKFVDLKTPLHKFGLPGPDLDFTNPLGPLNPINPLDGIPSVQNPLGDYSGLAGELRKIAAFFVGIGELILTPEGWLRLAKILGGAYLLLKGLNLVISESTGVDAAKAAKKAAVNAAETAAVVATVK